MVLYPDLALALLRHRQVPAGRAWLLLRHLDAAGQGWVHEADARAALSDNASRWRLCGPRQLRNLLAAGAGLFWTRSAGRLWLHGLTRVAAALGVARFATPAVLLPIRHLTGSVASVAAQLYASFHSGRGAAPRRGTRPAPPIARQTLAQITRLSRHTQRRYEAVAGVRRQVNLAVGAPLTASEEQNRAYQHGHALFRFIDRQGRQGPAGQAYVAWQLPNSYLGPHPRCAQRQRRRLNRRLADLLHQGTTGNGWHTTDQAARRRPRRFCRHGREAATQLNRAPSRDTYWPQRTSTSPTQCWHVLQSQPESSHVR